MIRSLCLFLCVASAILATCNSQIEHHVKISSPNGKECAGTIISKNWIVSTRNCTSTLTRPLTIHFSEKMGYSMSLTTDNIQVHPTDDLSMLNLPFDIKINGVHLNRGNVHLKSELNGGTVGFVPGHHNGGRVGKDPVIAVPFVYKENVGERLFKACYWKLVNGLEPDSLGSGFVKQGFLIGVLNKIDKNNCGIFTSIEESTQWFDEIIAASEK